MCGFAGTIALRGPGVTDALLANAAGALSRRGPDAQGRWREGPATLLHCRLRILDTSASADQPMVSTRQGRVVMVFNGEIYNFRELRADLERDGWSFSTRSDAEVLLSGYQHWGADVLRRARGMWAVAFWHPDEQRLLLARDPFGKKPLIYALSDGNVSFASNLPALLALLGRTPPVDRDAVACLLGNLVVPFEHCMFDGVAKLPPGSLLAWSPDREAKLTAYWKLPSPTCFGAPDRAGAAAEVERLLRQAVNRRLVSDVPLGLFLSAGLDSALVAAMAAQESGRSLVAVTAGTTGSGYDERAAAALVAQRYGLEHRPLEVPPLTASELPRLIDELGEPFGDPSLLPSYQVARVARQEITVALTGDGGDESFFGYETFTAVQWAARYRSLVPRVVRRWLWAQSRGQTTGWTRRVAALFEYGRGPVADAFRNRMAFDAATRAALVPGVLHDAEHVMSDRLRRWSALPDADALRRMFFETFLPNDYLTKVDTATMAASLEARCPFLDVDLVSFALSLPSSLAFSGARRKALLRPLAARLLPRELLRRPKTGFGIPVHSWLRGPLAPAYARFVVESRGAIVDLIDQRVALALFEAHRRGADHGHRLWLLLTLGVWSALFLDHSLDRSEPLQTGTLAA